eukprot:CAMPEP_0114551522 /NCGR_PEP_ID=MMETSP0114-20121206/6650_1 /TAXON_ID=31324 /ORGANISM="Goniomonas sp, Strain m" /LENGTH=762 /DNA_ID=CAMNT_0001736365 /DNA_START=76 /DNA_END=2361 /DNA_ORIENTATION=+
MYMIKPHMNGKNVTYNLHMKRDAECHQEKLKNMQSHLKKLGLTKTPQDVMVVQNNPKKRMKDEEHFLEVEAENARLLAKMTKILEAPRRALPTTKLFDARAHARNEEAKRIARMNQKLQERIDNTPPYYDREEWEQHRRKTEHVLRKMGFYPWSPPQLKQKQSRKSAELSDAEFLDNYWQRTMESFSEAHPEVVKAAEEMQPAISMEATAFPKPERPRSEEWLMPGLGRPGRHSTSPSFSPSKTMGGGAVRRSGNVSLKPLHRSMPESAFSNMSTNQGSTRLRNPWRAASSPPPEPFIAPETKGPRPMAAIVQQPVIQKGPRSPPPSKNDPPKRYPAGQVRPSASRDAEASRLAASAAVDAAKAKAAAASAASPPVASPPTDPPAEQPVATPGSAAVDEVERTPQPVVEVAVKRVNTPDMPERRPGTAESAKLRPDTAGSIGRLKTPDLSVSGPDYTPINTGREELESFRGVESSPRVRAAASEEVNVLNLEAEDKSAAAAKIQARARGMAGRKRAEDVKAGKVEPLPKPEHNPKANKTVESPMPEPSTEVAGDAADEAGLPDLADPDVANAAEKIQARARGMAGRKRAQDIKDGKEEPMAKPEHNPKANKTVDHNPKANKTVDSPTPEPSTEVAGDAADEEGLPDLADPDVANAAEKIQARARGMAGRKRAQDIKDGKEEPMAKPEHNPKANKTVDSVDSPTPKPSTEAPEPSTEVAGDAADEEGLPDLADPDVANAAEKIQARARGMAGRKRAQDIKDGK